MSNNLGINSIGCVANPRIETRKSREFHQTIGNSQHIIAVEIVEHTADRSHSSRGRLLGIRAGSCESDDQRIVPLIDQMAVGSQQSAGFRIPQAEGQTDLFVREPDPAESYVSGDTACSHLPEGEFPRHEIDRPVPDAANMTSERLCRNTVQNIFCGGRKPQLYLAPVITQRQLRA